MRSPISIRPIIAGSIGSQMLGDASAPLQFPTVNRKGKGNSLVARPRQPLPPLPPLLPIAPVPQDEVDAALKNDAVMSRIDPYAEYEFGAPRMSRSCPDCRTAACRSAAEKPCRACAERRG